MGQPRSRVLAESVTIDAIRGDREPSNRVERIRAYELLLEVRMTGGDLVTPTMKVRRRAVLQRYADRVDALYAAR